VASERACASGRDATPLATAALTAPGLASGPDDPSDVADAEPPADDAVPSADDPDEDDPVETLDEPSAAEDAASPAGDVRLATTTDCGAASVDSVGAETTDGAETGAACTTGLAGDAAGVVTAAGVTGATVTGTPVTGAGVTGAAATGAGVTGSGVAVTGAETDGAASDGAGAVGVATGAAVCAVLVVLLDVEVAGGGGTITTGIGEIDSRPAWFPVDART